MSKVKLSTNHGDIVIRLDAQKAPATVENFLGYVQDRFYDGTVFHRVIDNFMIQGGGMEPGLRRKETRAPIQNEADNGLKNVRYSVALARTADPHSATAQFFVNAADNAFLDHTAKPGPSWGYAVFAEVVEGHEVVDQIKSVPTTSASGHSDVPKEDIVLVSAEVVE
ncbi:peptidylprolyl isomerase [Streptomyces lavendulae]|uniref:peptidylprolyl isomerase n=1 Tax=Streptomyces lavendulae TaxID=1914 RepID=UPI00381425B5